MKEYFVYFDEVNVVLPFHKIKVLVDNGDDYSLINLPININCSLKEYQNNVGKFVYILHEKEDEKFIKNNLSYINVLEGENNHYSILRLFDSKSVNVKRSDIGNIIGEVNKKFAIYKNSYNLTYSDEIYVLKQNPDNTVSVKKAPLFIKKSMLQYQIENDCYLVVSYRDSLNCDNDDIIELEPLGDDNKYDVIRIYDKKNVKVKKSKYNIKNM